MQLCHNRSGRRAILAIAVATIVASASAVCADDVANPLATIPLSALTATRDRPLFSPTRAAAPVVEAVAPAMTAAAPQVVAAEPVPFVLVGTVTGEGRQIALVARSGGGDVIALAPGDVRDGWAVRAVSARRAVLDSNGRSEEIALPDLAAEMAGAVRPASNAVAALEAPRLAGEPGKPADAFAMPIARVLTR